MTHHVQFRRFCSEPQINCVIRVERQRVHENFLNSLRTGPELFGEWRAIVWQIGFRTDEKNRAGAVVLPNAFNSCGSCQTATENDVRIDVFRHSLTPLAL